MLSDQDVQRLREAVEAGKPATVWFTAKAVGVEAGKSGKVLSFAQPAEGDFIEVKPTGSHDALSFSQAELTLTKPKPKRQPPTPTTPKTASPATTKTTHAPTQTPSPTAVTPLPEQIYQPAEAEKPARKPARRQSSKPPAEVTVTLHSTERGDWTVEVVVGKKRSLRPTPIPAAVIVKIAKDLPNQVEDAISAVIAAARQQHQERIALLQAELDAARRAFNDLS
jgi:hypothetical protein